MKELTTENQVALLTLADSGILMRTPVVMRQKDDSENILCGYLLTETPMSYLVACTAKDTPEMFQADDIIQFPKSSWVKDTPDIIYTSGNYVEEKLYTSWNDNGPYIIRCRDFNAIRLYRIEWTRDTYTAYKMTYSLEQAYRLADEDID